MSKLVRCVVAAAAGLFIGGASQAQVVNLPPVNEMTVGVYGDFYVYSLELLDKCQTAGDVRCLSSIDPKVLSGPYPDPSNTGTIGNYVLIYKNADGGSQGNYQSPTGPLTLPQTVDNPFDSNTGVGSNFDMSTLNEPSGATGNNYGVQPFAADFTGDQNGTWEASLSALYTYLNGGELFFFFGNNQLGAGLDQVQYLWAQVKVVDSTGAQVNGNCWELNSTYSAAPSAGTGCGTTNPTYETDPAKRTPLAAGDFVGTGGAFCVDTTTGASYVPLSSLPGKDADCAVSAANSSDGLAHTAGYFISNNLGQNTAEFAAFLPQLNANLKTWAEAGYFMQVNFKARNLNDGGDQLWIRSIGVEPVIVPEPVPEPATLALVGLGLLGAVGFSRRRRVA